MKFEGCMGVHGGAWGRVVAKSCFLSSFRQSNLLERIYFSSECKQCTLCYVILLKMVKLSIVRWQSNDKSMFSVEWYPHGMEVTRENAFI